MFHRLVILFIFTYFERSYCSGSSSEDESETVGDIVSWAERCDKENEDKCANTVSPDDIIELLKLQPLVGEGGYFNETYRATDIVQWNSIDQTASTQIYYMITPQSYSSLHKLTKDEVWHFYMGDSTEMLLIYPNGEHKIVTLGNDIMNGEILQYVIHKEVWFGAKIKKAKCGYSLFGATVAPGFEFVDFTHGERDNMIEMYPHLEELIVEYTYPS
eukprot:448014_1